jgi:hypothetical protein
LYLVGSSISSISSNHAPFLTLYNSPSCSSALSWVPDEDLVLRSESENEDYFGVTRITKSMKKRLSVEDSSDYFCHTKPAVLYESEDQCHNLLDCSDEDESSIEPTETTKAVLVDRPSSSTSRLCSSSILDDDSSSEEDADDFLTRIRKKAASQAKTATTQHSRELMSDGDDSRMEIPPNQNGIEVIDLCDSPF